MQDLLGMCIDNTAEMSLTINVTHEVHEVMKRILAIVERHNQGQAEEDDEEGLATLSERIKAIRDRYNKLLEDRSKHKILIA